MNNKLTSKAVISISALLASSCVIADDQLGEAINTLKAAYGGSKLTSLPAITIHDHRKSLWPGQNESASSTDFWRINEELTIDFSNNTKGMLSWRVDRTNTDLEHYIANENAGRVYDVLNKRYTDDQWYNFKNTGASIERSSDTLVAKKLIEAKSDVLFVGEANYQGTPHYKLSYTLSGNAPSVIYIDKRSGFISKVSRQHPSGGELTYAFSNYSQVEGIGYARDMNFFVLGEPRVISTYRNIDIAPNLSSVLTPPKDYLSWGKPVDNSQMSHALLAPSIYHVGQGRSRALFVDVGDYFISVGGDRKLKENFNSLQNYLGSSKPLKMAVLTHHHSEHLNMIQPALNLGAKLITVAKNKVVIEEKLGKSIEPANFIFVEKSLSLWNGKLIIHDIPTAHTDNNLVAYLPKEKILYAEDHYETPYQKGLPRPFNNMVKFERAISELGLDIEYLVDGASPRILTMKEFKLGVKSFTKPSCPQGYRICQNG